MLFVWCVARLGTLKLQMQGADVKIKPVGSFLNYKYKTPLRFGVFGLSLYLKRSLRAPPDSKILNLPFY